MLLLQFCAVVLVWASATIAATSNLPKGFVTTNGPSFELDGKPFAFVGANSYWLPLLTTAADVDSTFQQMQEAGVKVVRTWAFNAINGSELAGAKQSGLTYYQIWNSSDWVLNDGPQGLERLDNVVNSAGKFGIKLIMTLTNNWVGYGGMELYINWIAGAGNTHDVFYTDKRIISSYQKYAKTIVERYKSSPNVFAWELVNEARCLGDLPSGPACVPGTNLLNKWYKQQSDFVRSLDPHHMITTGGEGQFFFKGPTFFTDSVPSTDYNFNGQAGEDFALDLQLDNIDFGTYHLYPQTWYPQLDFAGSAFTVQDWGVAWIQLHADAAKTAGKPLVLEEFGLGGLQNKSDFYPAWVNAALDTGHGGIMPWQFGASGLTEAGGNRLIKYADALINGASPNDGLAIYKNQSLVWDIFTNAAIIQNSRSN